MKSKVPDLFAVHLCAVSVLLWLARFDSVLFGSHSACCPSCLSQIRYRWVEWMRRPDPDKTKGGNLKSPSPKLLCEWIKQAWDDIPTALIIKSFLKAGISNALDGSQDELIFDDVDVTEGLPAEPTAVADHNDDCDLELWYACLLVCECVCVRACVCTCVRVCECVRVCFCLSVLLMQ